MSSLFLLLSLCLFSEFRVMEITGYCSCPICCESSADGITASGHIISPGDKFAAADRQWKFGTLVTVRDYNDSKPVIVLDRGGSIKGNRLDLYFDNHKAALEWGRSMKIVRIQE